MDLQEDSQQSRFKDQEGEVRSAQSAASSETHVEGYDELAEMTLLLNLTSELVDIEEAHLRFQRRTNEAEFRLGMPTLKRFARPLDWENLNGYLRHYARQASEKQSLGSIMLRMPGESRKLLQARRATISSPYAQTPNQPARLFLHLANFKDKRPKNSRPRLAGLDENAKVDDEPRSAAINSASSGSQSSPQRLRESSGEETHPVEPPPEPAKTIKFDPPLWKQRQRYIALVAIGLQRVLGLDLSESRIKTASRRLAEKGGDGQHVDVMQADFV
eukprot:s2272_g1.t1